MTGAEVRFNGIGLVQFITKKEACVGFLCYLILFASLAGSRLVSQISAI